MRIFGDENIMINDTLEEIMKELKDEDSFLVQAAVSLS